MIEPMREKEAELSLRGKESVWAEESLDNS
jgi:hypothetical protein